MVRFACSLLSVLHLLQPPAEKVPTPAGPDPVVKFPSPQINAQPMKPFVVRAETNLKYRKWTIPTGLERVPSELTKHGDDEFVGYGPSGVYKFHLEGTLNDKFTEGECVVFVGVITPGPLGPVAPVSPTADVVLIAALQKLYDDDADKNGKGVSKAKLCQLWKEGAAQVRGNKLFLTMKQFTDTIHAQGASFPIELKDSDLRAIRLRVHEDLTTACGGPETKLEAPKSECREKAAVVLERFAAALASVK
jgi:hypothetical protein